MAQRCHHQLLDGILNPRSGAASWHGSARPWRREFISLLPKCKIRSIIHVSPPETGRMSETYSNANEQFTEYHGNELRLPLDAASSSERRVLLSDRSSGWVRDQRLTLHAHERCRRRSQAQDSAGPVSFQRHSIRQDFGCFQQDTAQV